MKQVSFVLLCLTAVLIVYKVVHFRLHFNKKSFLRFLHFPGLDKLPATNNASLKLKERQNLLTVFTLIGLMLTFILYILSFAH